MVLTLARFLNLVFLLLILPFLICIPIFFFFMSSIVLSCSGLASLVSGSLSRASVQH